MEFYLADRVLIDFVIFYLVFAIVLREFLIKTFGREDYFITMLYLVLSFCFSFSVVVWEMENYFSILDYWKFFLGLIVVFIFWRVRNYFQKSGAYS